MSNVKWKEELTLKEEEWLWKIAEYQLNHETIFTSRGSTVPPSVKSLCRRGFLAGRTVTISNWISDNPNMPPAWEKPHVYWEVQITDMGERWLQGKN